MLIPVNRACRWSDNVGEFVGGGRYGFRGDDALLDVSTLKLEVADHDPSMVTGLRNFSIDGIVSEIMF